MTAAIPTRALRGAVLGLGMIGRHHARLLQASPDVDFAGAVDPGGDRFGAVHDPAQGLRVDRRPAGASTSRSSPCRRRTTSTRVRALAAARRAPARREAAGRDDRRGPGGHRRRPRAPAFAPRVGHVERFNPALIELRRRLDELGEVLLIRTERVGPFPDRVKDVGVVKDLGTHDLDLVRWLGGSPVALARGADRRTSWAASTRTSCS